MSSLGAMWVDAAANLVPRLQASAPTTDTDGACPTEAMDWLHEAGLCSAPLPQPDSGPGLNDGAERLALLCVLKHIGRGNLVVGRLYEGHVNALQLVSDFGNAAQKADVARAAAAGQWFGVWNSQGTDGVRLGAGASSNAWTLDGTKLYASGAGFIHRPLVTAQRTDGGWQMVLTRAGGADAAADANADAANATATDSTVHVDSSFWQPLGMRGSASFRVTFNRFPVDAADLLGNAGDYYREPAFSAGAVRFAAVQMGGAEAVLDETRRFLRRIHHADDPYQRIRLGEMAMCVEGGNLWFEGAARHVGDALYAHLMRSAIEQTGLRVMQLAERCVGARGLLRPSPLERMHRDLTHYLRQPAPDAVLAAAGAHVLASEADSHLLWGR